MPDRELIIDHDFDRLLQDPGFRAFWLDNPDNLFVMHCLADDFILLGINPAQERVINQSHELMRGRSLRGFFPEALYDRFTANYRRCVEERRQICYEEPFKNEQDEYSYWETLLTPVFAADGRVEYIWGRSRDITARCLAEQALAEEQRRLENANQVKTTFLANMSHEMRTPLNGITGAVSLLVDADDEAERSSLLGIINASVEQLSRLTNDILDYAKLNAGSLKLQLKSFSARQMATEVAALLGHLADDNKTRIHLAWGQDCDLQLYGDVGRIKQILINFTTNAIKFTPGGVVEIGVAVVVRQDGLAQLTLAVKDSGIGISDVDLKRLFEPFTQLDNSATRRYQGVGLGLAICRQLADLMGGSIQVRSSPGQGSTFSLEVLLHKAAAEPSAVVAQAPGREQGGMFKGLVLLVEDNPTNCIVAEKMLQKLGLTVVVAHNGEDAIEQVKRQSFKLILMDWHMPVMDGLTATKRIRSLGPEEARMPIVGLTANVLSEQKAMCLHAGMDDVVTKPIEKPRLISVLQRFL